MEANTPEERETFELTAQNRLQKLKQAVDEASQKFEVPLTVEQVITYGIKALGKTHAVLKYDMLPQGRQLTATLEATLNALMQEGATTLPGLLASARNYQPSQYSG